LGLGVSTGADEISVIARVSDVKAWESLSEVRIGTTISDGKGKKGAIVTARIPASRVEFVRKQKFVKSLKATRPLRPALHATTEETNSRPVDLPVGSLSDGGRGVVIGVIDYECDFAHQNFRNVNGGTRIESLWVQWANSGNHPTSFDYGREYSSTEIDAALNTGDPYGSLNYTIPIPGPRVDPSHGTHVMDIAGGNGSGSGTPGVAPNSTLVFVDISHSDLPIPRHPERDDAFHDPASEHVKKSLGDSVRLLEAVKYIFEKAGDRPCVVNISLGTNGGPHDGTTLVEQGIDSLVSQAPNRVVCIAASNSFSDGIHAAGSVAENSFMDLQWDVGADLTASEFELWYDGVDRFDVELITPGGHSFGRVSPGSQLPLTNQFQEVVAFISNRLNDPNNNDNMIGIYLDKPLPQWNPAGTWVVRIHGTNVADGSFHAWIERDNANQSSFPNSGDNTHTIGSISCGHKTIVVASYDGHKPSKPISFFSSAGPTRDGREKPEIAAPGHAVQAALSRSVSGVTPQSGTSMASPAVAGICALALAEASQRGIDLSIDEMRDIVIESGRSNPPTGSAWSDRYGHGRIDTSDILEAVISMSPVSLSAASNSRTKKKTKKKVAKKKTKKKRSSTKKKKVTKKKSATKKARKKKKTTK